MKTGILIAGHGSTMSFNKGVLEMQADRLREMGFENVYVGFNESSFPLLGEAAETMAEDGIEKIVVLPFFVASGLHVTRDFPVKHFGMERDATDGIATLGGKRVEIHIEQPFGDDPVFATLLKEKLEELRSPDKISAVLLMGHGSRLSYNREVIGINADRLRSMGYDRVYVGFNEFDEPRIEDVVPKIIDDGAEEIVALPLFITLGKHLTMDIPGKIGIRNFSDGGTVCRGGREIAVKYATPVGADPRLCEVLAGKLRRLGFR